MLRHTKQRRRGSRGKQTKRIHRKSSSRRGSKLRRKSSSVRRGSKMRRRRSTSKRGSKMRRTRSSSKRGHKMHGGGMMDFFSGFLSAEKDENRVIDAGAEAGAATTAPEAAPTAGAGAAPEAAGAAPAAAAGEEAAGPAIGGRRRKSGGYTYNKSTRNRRKFAGSRKRGGGCGCSLV